MTFPFTFRLQNGTEVEVTLNARGNKYIFDLFKNGRMFDSFAWAPDANIRKEDIGVSDHKSLEARHRETVDAFKELQG